MWWSFKGNHQKKKHFNTINLFVYWAIGAFYFNASYIDTSPQHLNISNTSNNIFNGNLCETLNAGIDLKKQVIQRGSKILQLHSYGSVKKVGKFSCIADGLIEPYLITTNFSCGESGILLSNQQRWRLQNKCRSFTKKTIKCSQYNEEFQNDIDKINYTRFKYNEEVYAFDLPEGNDGLGVFGRDFIESNTNVLASYVDKVQTLHNSFLMGAMICSIANSGQVNNVSSFCLRRPNRRECYGEFGDNFVNFPEHYFPTHEGGWGEQTPGTPVNLVFLQTSPMIGVILNLIILVETSDLIQTLVLDIIQELI